MVIAGEFWYVSGQGMYFVWIGIRMSRMRKSDVNNKAAKPDLMTVERPYFVSKLLVLALWI